MMHESSPLPRGLEGVDQVAGSRLQGSRHRGTVPVMERSQREHLLEEIIPDLEAEHDAEPDNRVREAIWKLISATEEYLLERRASWVEKRESA